LDALRLGQPRSLQKISGLLPIGAGSRQAYYDSDIGKSGAAFGVDSKQGQGKVNYDQTLTQVDGLLRGGIDRRSPGSNFIGGIARDDDGQFSRYNGQRVLFRLNRTFLGYWADKPK
jgi:hypothetical protein